MGTSTAHYGEKDKYEGRIFEVHTYSINHYQKCRLSRLRFLPPERGQKKNIEVASSKDAHVCFGAAQENLASEEGSALLLFCFFVFGKANIAKELYEDTILLELLTNTVQDLPEERRNGIQRHRAEAA